MSVIALGYEIAIQEEKMGEESSKVIRRRALRVMAMSAMAARRWLANDLGYAFGGARDYYKVLGYERDISIAQYMARYRRQDIAGRIVDLPAIDTWRNPPKISEADKTDTAFVRDWEELTKRVHTWAYLSRADRLSGIGRYGVLFIGVRGNKDLSQPLKADELAGPDSIIYLRAASENKAKINAFDTNKASPRYGHPETYMIEVSEGNSAPIHWTRVIHLADDKVDSEVFGRPRLERVYNRLDDLVKLVGGSAEASWLQVNKGLLLSTQDGYDWPAEDSDEAEAFLREVEEYAHGMRRVMKLAGTQATHLGGEAIDPSAPFGVEIALIAAAADMPQRVLIGSARGELSAASEDAKAWYGQVSWRQTNYAEPAILRPFIDRLVWMGALSQPAGGRGAYDIGEVGASGVRSWPSLFEMSELDQAEISSKKASAARALADPFTGELPITHHESRALLGYPPEPDIKEPEIEHDEFMNELLQDDQFVASMEAVRAKCARMVANDGLGDYGRGIRGAVRGLWSGVFDLFQFVDNMLDVIQRGLALAWADGMAEMGADFGERTPDEEVALQRMINQEITHAPGFGQDIEAGNKDSGGKLRPFLTRAEMWARRYVDARNRAMLMVTANPKMEWVYGDTIDHCPDCKMYVGRVYRKDTWARYDIRPQSRRLACSGIKCDCRFVVTDKPVTSGRPPSPRGPR